MKNHLFVRQIVLAVGLTSLAQSTLADLSSMTGPTHPNWRSEQQQQDEAGEIARGRNAAISYALENPLPHRLPKAEYLVLEEQAAARALEKQNEIESILRESTVSLREEYRKLYEKAQQYEKDYQKELLLLLRMAAHLPDTVVFDSFNRTRNEIDFTYLDGMARNYNADINMTLGLNTIEDFNTKPKATMAELIYNLRQAVKNYEKFRSPHQPYSAMYYRYVAKIENEMIKVKARQVFMHASSGNLIPMAVDAGIYDNLLAQARSDIESAKGTPRPAKKACRSYF